MSNVTWTDYDDGSGSMKSPYGRSFFSYDKMTGEIKDIDGRWQQFDFGSDWKQNCEDYYYAKVEPKEAEYAKLLKQGIVAPYFNDMQYSKDKTQANYIAVNSDYAMSKSDFIIFAESVRDAESDNFRDYTSSDLDVANLIASSMSKNHIVDNCYVCEFENKQLTFSADSIHKISDFVSESKQQSVHTSRVKQAESLCDFSKDSDDLGYELE